MKKKRRDWTAEISVDTSSMDMSAMGGSGISIQVRGRDLDTLRAVLKGGCFPCGGGGRNSGCK